MSKIEELLDTKSESFYHKAIKELIYKFVSQKNYNVIEGTTEKYFGKRRADIFFKLRGGKKVVVEVQHSRISIKELKERTEEYNKQGIYVLWILHGKGKCVASSKFPENKKNVKISSAEKFLHMIYGGRVYYVNINKNKCNTSITLPFALHYSISDCRKLKKKAFRKNYEYYYIRNSNFTYIPNWNLLTTSFYDYKIARFYDKNIKTILKNQIDEFLQEYEIEILECLKNSKKTKKKTKILIKKVIKNFKRQYGKSILLKCIDSIKDRYHLNDRVLLKFKNKSHF